MKKILSLFLSLIMIISVASMAECTAFAATYSGSCGDNAKWSLNTSTGVLTISGSGEFYNSDYWGSWDSYRDYIKKVIISNGITVIGSESFWGYESLTSVSIPSTVYEIDSWAFCNTGLTEVTIPSNVKTIGYNAFVACNSLKSFNVAASNNYFASINGNLYNKSKTILLQYAAGKSDTAFNIPNTVVEIGEAAFSHCNNLISILIPNSVTKIGDEAFELCHDLYEITIPASVKEIGYWPFDGCTSLNSINVDSNNQHYSSMSGVLFNKAKTELIKFPDWHWYYIEKYTIPSTVKTIADYALSSSVYFGDRYIVVPNTVTEIGYHALGSNVTLYGHSGSAAEQYAAKEDSVKFVNKHDGKTSLTKATLSKNGKKVVDCAICNKTITSTIYYPKTIKLSATSYTYNGKVKKPSVTVKDSKGNKISASNYTVTFSKGRKNVGKYTVTIKFKGNYSGTVKKTFTIKPKATNVSSISTPKSAQIKLKWKKVSNIDGYEIQVSKTNKFSSQTKKYTAKASATNKTLKFLKKTKSYVRIRTYKKVNGKKYYSSWSKVKSIKTK